MLARAQGPNNDNTYIEELLLRVVIALASVIEDKVRHINVVVRSKLLLVEYSIACGDADRHGDVVASLARRVGRGGAVRWRVCRNSTNECCSDSSGSEGLHDCGDSDSKRKSDGEQSITNTWDKGEYYTSRWIGYALNMTLANAEL